MAKNKGAEQKTAKTKDTANIDGKTQIKDGLTPKLQVTDPNVERTNVRKKEVNLADTIAAEVQKLQIDQNKGTLGLKGQKKQTVDTLAK